MPKVGMAPIRRQQLIAATIKCLSEEGYARTTVLRVSRRAKLSPGIVAHYFNDKVGLLVATMKHLNKRIGAKITSRMKAATTPEERLYAIIDTQFTADELTPEMMKAWLALWGQINEVPELDRFQRIYERRLHSNLMAALRELMPPEKARMVAAGLAALIDGLWLKAALPSNPLTAAEAVQIAHDYVRMVLDKYGHRLTEGRRAQ